MMKVAIISGLSISLFIVALGFFYFVSEDSPFDIIKILNNTSSIIFLFLIFGIPIITSSFLLIDFIGIFKNIMYSVKMTILCSLVYVGINIILNIVFHDYYFRSILLISVIGDIYISFFIKQVFYNRYQKFQNDVNNVVVYPYINRRIDITIAIIACLTLLIPSLCLFFTMF